MNDDRNQRTFRAVRSAWVAALVFLGALSVFALNAVPVYAQSAHADSSDKTAPTFAIINPLYYGQKLAQGPVGTYVAVQATGGWTIGATIVLGVQEGTVPVGTPCDASKEIPVLPVAPMTVDGKGAFSGIFTWPASAPKAVPYSVCANEEGNGTQSGASSNTFTVVSAAPPTLTLSSATLHAGDKITISGQNWLPGGQQISLLLATTGLLPFLLNDPTKTISDGSGNFSAEITLPLDLIGDRTFVATMGNATMLPNNATQYYPLQAHSETFSIAGPLPTQTVQPTVAPTTTPKPAVTATAGTPGSSTSPRNDTILIGLLALIAVVLLLAGIVVAVLVLRGHTPRQNAGWGNTPADSRTQQGAVWRGSEPQAPDWNQVWQNPTGQPWSGRASSRPFNSPMPPPLEEEEDPYRTRMGGPSQVTQQPTYRPAGSRPTPPRPGPSRPNAPLPPPDWSTQDTYTSGDTAPNGRPPTPQR